MPAAKKKVTGWWVEFFAKYKVCKVPKWVKEYPSASAAWKAAAKDPKRSVDVARFVDVAANYDVTHKSVAIDGEKLTFGDLIDALEYLPPKISAGIVLKVFPTWESYLPFALKSDDEPEAA